MAASASVILEAQLAVQVVRKIIAVLRAAIIVIDHFFFGATAFRFANSALSPSIWIKVSKFAI